MLAMNSDLSPSANNDSGAAYRRNQIKSCCFLGILFICLLIALVLSLRAGSYSTPVAELVKGVLGKAADDKINLVVRSNRLPRICTALIAGAGLGLAGCVMQAILRNPLASASTLGVSQGAGFGAAFAIIVLNMGAVGKLGSVAIPLFRKRGRKNIAIATSAITATTSQAITQSPSLNAEPFSPTICSVERFVSSSEPAING